MRTTLTIDEDIALRIQDLRRRRGHSLKQVINRLLREGLRSSQQTPHAKPYRTKTRKLGLRPGFDTAGFNQLVDELEAEEYQVRETLLRQ
ncbi:MAG: antitoxin [Acidobacteriota bacterium]|nr:antitoxin [Acidobacteriota bacterium]